MPRNRKTKGRPSHRHAKAVMPDGSEGNDLDKDDRQAKIDAMLSDFDLEVKNRITEMKKDINIFVRRLQMMYSVEILKLPKHVRETRISTFLANGGRLDDLIAEDDDVESNIDARVESTKRTKALLAEQENTTTTKVRGKPPAATRTGAGGRTMRHRQALMETPFNQQVLSKTGWGATPLVTPKFDPRLPITPAIGRRARPGEVTMSMHGSPINPSDDQGSIPEVILPICSDKRMRLTAHTELLDVEIPQMSATTLQQIRSIQQKLQQIMQAHTAK